MQFPKEQKALSQFFFFFFFLNFYKILHTFKKKMTLIADVFWRLRIPKNVFR